ncbi:unnamed protein product [Fraxinus pennsylvanica]|uniref:Exocyst complex component Sec8 n=1 Tax=Fraxinus pennsylvanica TaxID=56036 RepID=A0AAD2DVE3_9LAMI|nr:unnamed protein product [Fraxinus pennsylvanica]
MGIFDGLPISREKSYLKEELSKIDENWAAARFDSLPHVVHILTSKDREGDVQILKEQSDIIEEVVDEVVHAYHGGFNKAIQNYSQILRLFSESAQDIGVLKVDLADAKKLLGARNKQLHQLWYRSVTLRHIISLLDQIEGIAKVPGRIEKLIAEKQFYAAVQLHLQSSLMLEREGLQTVGALQDVRSELTKLRGVLFYKVLEDLHSHLYNKGEYSSVVSSINEIDDAMPTTTAIAFSMNNPQPLSRRTRLLKGDSQLGTYGAGDRFYRPSSVDGGSSFDGHDENGGMDGLDDATSDGYTMRVNGRDTVSRDGKIVSLQIPIWLSDSTPDEFVEAMRKSDAPLHVKYLQTMVECLCMLGKVAAAGAIISQRLRPTIRQIITTKIKAQADHVNCSRTGIGQAASNMVTGLHYLKGRLESHQLPKQKRQNGLTLAGTLLAVSPVSPVMSPAGTAQTAAKELLDSILDIVVRIFENHIIVGELLELKSSLQVDLNTPKVVAADINWNPDSDASRDTGGYTLGFSLTVLQSECQQLICEILRATPEAASADAAVQTARLASKAPSKDKRSEDGLTFAFRFTDATIPIPNQGADLIRQGWSRRGPNVLQEGYGTAAVLPEQGIYLAASVYRPVVQFTDKVASMLPEKFSQLGNDGLLTFVENFVKDHFLPTMFVDYRKGVQQAISSPAAFRPRAHAAASYTPSIEKGRPVLQGLLAIDLLSKEVLGWAQAMPKFAESIERLGYSSMKDRDQLEEKRSHHSRTSSAPTKDLASFAEEYRKLSIDCLKVLRVEMQLETVFHMQEMTSREYLDDQDAEEPDDFVISLTSQITRRDEEMTPFVAGEKRNYIFGGICSIAANAFMKALVDIKSINLFGVQQICRNSIALEQALAAISSIDNEAIQLRLDRVRTYYELLNMPFEALLAFIAEHDHLFTSAEYTNLLKVQVPGREIPSDSEDRVAEVLPR